MTKRGFIVEFLRSTQTFLQHHETIGNVGFANRTIKVQTKYIDSGITLFDFVFHASAYDVIGNAAKGLKTYHRICLVFCIRNNLCRKQPALSKLHIQRQNVFNALCKLINVFQRREILKSAQHFVELFDLMSYNLVGLLENEVGNVAFEKIVLQFGIAIDKALSKKGRKHRR